MPATIDERPVSVRGAGVIQATTAKVINLSVAHPTTLFTSVTSDNTLKIAFTPESVLSGADYPTLEAIWDNPSDAIFDTL